MASDWKAIWGERFAGKRAMVTGGAGFIGSHLAEVLVRLGATVTVLDDLSHGSAGNVASGARLVVGSILDGSALKDAMAGAEWVFHLAALGSVPRSVEQPELYTRVNVMGTMAVLEEARQSGARRVVFAASSSAYGDTEELPKHEGMPPRGLSPYAATKVAGEALMRAWANSYAVDTVSLRYFNIFGPRQNANSAYAAVIAAFARALLAGERPVIFGDGSQTRDFTHVDNAVQANLLAAMSDKRLAGEVVNVATGSRISIRQLAEEMARVLKRSDLGPVYKPARTGDVLHSQASLRLAESVLGYRPIVAWEAGLAETLGWYRAETGS